MISGASEQELDIANARAELLLEIKDKDKEIERLNNIINELEFYLIKGTREKLYFRVSLYWNEACEDILYELNKLKSGDNNVV